MLSNRSEFLENMKNEVLKLDKERLSKEQLKIIQEDMKKVAYDSYGHVYYEEWTAFYEIFAEITRFVYLVPDSSGDNEKAIEKRKQTWYKLIAQFLIKVGER